MRKAFRTLRLAALLSLVLGGALHAQNQQFPPTLPSNSVYGRLGAGVPGPAQAIPFSTLAPAIINNLPINNNGQVYNAALSGWLCDGNDRSTQALALLNTVSAGGGGTIFFPPCAALAISSGTYNSGTGVVTLTTSAATGIPSGGGINIQLTGTGTQKVTEAGSSLNNADTVSLVFTDSSIVGSPVTVTYTLGMSESNTTIATGLVSAINGNATLTGSGIGASNSGTAVITLTGVKGTTLIVQTKTGTGAEAAVIGVNSLIALAKPIATSSVSGTTITYAGTSGLGTTTITGGSVRPTYRADSQLLIPNNGEAMPAQVNFAFAGAGGGNLGYSAAPNNGYPYPSVAAASVIDLRFHNSDSQSGKIESRGQGALYIHDLEFVDLSSSNATPFLHDTNSTLTIQNNTFVGSGNTGQDAIVLGGTSVALDGSLNAAFQGYGTIIEGNLFTNGNRGVYARTFVNSIVIAHNTFPFQGNTGTTAIEFDGSAASCSHACNVGNYVVGNLVEMDTYTCGIKMTVVSDSVFSGNSFWDTNNLNGNYCFGGNDVGGNTFILGHSEQQSGSSNPAIAGGVFYDPASANVSSNTIIGGQDGFHAHIRAQLAGTSASINVPSGVTTPTHLNDGDIWYDGTSLYFRQGTNTDTFSFGAGGGFPAPAGTSSLPGSSVGTTAYGMFQATNELGFSVAGADKLDYGATNSGSWTFTGNVFTNGSYVLGSGSTVLGTPSWGSFGPNSDGVWVLLNNAGTGWGRLQFGGATSSFPALKRNGTAINVRLADDSADAPITASTGGFSGAITNAGITTDSGQTATATVCEDTTTHQFYFGSGTAGICKGTSSIRFKQGVSALSVGLSEILAMQPVIYYAKPGYGDPDKPLYGLLAEDMEHVSKVITEHDKDGKPSSVDYVGIIPVLINAIKQQQVEIDALKRRPQR